MRKWVARGIAVGSGVVMCVALVPCIVTPVSWPLVNAATGVFVVSLAVFIVAACVVLWQET